MTRMVPFSFITRWNACQLDGNLMYDAKNVYRLISRVMLSHDID